MTETSSPETKTEPAKRYDIGKPRYDLIPPEALEELAKLYEMGARKYSDRNWEKGMSWSRCFGPLMRHAWAYWRGEDTDPESGLPHMVHVAWNALALVHFGKFKRYHAYDDRAKQPEESVPPMPTEIYREHVTRDICTARKIGQLKYERTCDGGHFAPAKKLLLRNDLNCWKCGGLRVWKP